MNADTMVHRYEHRLECHVNAVVASKNLQSIGLMWPMRSNTRMK